MKQYYSKLIGGILLVAGTATGAGMLALPVSTGAAGFFPSIFLLILCWAYFTYSGLLMLEVNLWMGDDANLTTMSKKTLGLFGEVLSWTFYMFLLYALTTAYIAGSGSVMVNFLEHIFGVTTETWIAALPLIFIFGFFIYHGTSHVDLFNRILMAGLVITYILLVAGITPDVSTEMLSHIDWQPLLLGVSVAVTSFGYHIIIPSLTHYFHKDVKSIRSAIIIGSFCPFVIYAIWMVVTLGVLPLETITLGYHTGDNGADLVSDVLQRPVIAILATFFAFFAIITSFLGVAMSLSDFLADGFKIEKSRWGRIFLCALTFVPPLFFSMTDPRAFLTALEYAGAFGVITLLGFLPALMVWWGRYHRGLDKHAHYRAPGGKPALLLVMVTAVGVSLLEVLIKLGY